MEKGDDAILSIKDIASVPNQIPVAYKRLPESVTAGALIFLNGGLIQLRVEKVSGEDEKVIWVEDQVPDDKLESLSMKIIKT